MKCKIPNVAMNRFCPIFDMIRFCLVNKVTKEKKIVLQFFRAIFYNDWTTSFKTICIMIGTIIFRLSDLLIRLCM